MRIIHPPPRRRLSDHIHSGQGLGSSDAASGDYPKQYSYVLIRSPFGPHNGNLTTVAPAAACSSTFATKMGCSSGQCSPNHVILFSTSPAVYLPWTGCKYPRSQEDHPAVRVELSSLYSISRALFILLIMF